MRHARVQLALNYCGCVVEWSQVRRSGHGLRTCHLRTSLAGHSHLTLQKDRFLARSNRQCAGRDSNLSKSLTYSSCDDSRPGLTRSCGAVSTHVCSTESPIDLPRAEIPTWEARILPLNYQRHMMCTDLPVNIYIVSFIMLRRHRIHSIMAMSLGRAVRIQPLSVTSPQRIQHPYSIPFTDTSSHDRPGNHRDCSF